MMESLDSYLLASGYEIVDKLKAIHSVLLSNGSSICGFPVGNICRANYIVLHFAGNPNHTDAGPILRATFKFLHIKKRR